MKHFHRGTRTIEKKITSTKLDTSIKFDDETFLEQTVAKRRAIYRVLRYSIDSLAQSINR